MIQSEIDKYVNLWKLYFHTFDCISTDKFQSSYLANIFYFFLPNEIVAVPNIHYPLPNKTTNELPMLLIA